MKTASLVQVDRDALRATLNSYRSCIGSLARDIETARESVGFVSKEVRGFSRRVPVDCDPDDPSYPAADYRGEWLHITDHGNVTLYVRKDRQGIFKCADSLTDYIDSEIWSVV